MTYFACGRPSGLTFAALTLACAARSSRCERLVIDSSRSETEAAMQKARPQGTGFSHCKSLAVTYFHTGIRTIIGAISFHCPVRNGKEWVQDAMAAKHNCCPADFSSERIRKK